MYRNIKLLCCVAKVNTVLGQLYFKHNQTHRRRNQVCYHQKCLLYACAQSSSLWDISTQTYWVAPQQNAFPKTKKMKTLKINWSTVIIYFTVFHKQTNHLKSSLCLLYIIQYWWAKGPITDKLISQSHLLDLLVQGRALSIPCLRCLKKSTAGFQ